LDKCVGHNLKPLYF